MCPLEEDVCACVFGVGEYAVAEGFVVSGVVVIGVVWVVEYSCDFVHVVVMAILNILLLMLPFALPLPYLFSSSQFKPFYKTKPYNYWYSTILTSAASSRNIW